MANNVRHPQRGAPLKTCGITNIHQVKGKQAAISIATVSTCPNSCLSVEHRQGNNSNLAGKATTN
jgi:hypothetical protein